MMLAIVDPDPIIIVPECVGKACDVPGWDWLWILLSCVGGAVLLIALVIFMCEWLDP